MILAFKNFLASDTGAVTVDWVVLAAAVTGLGIGTVGAVRTGVFSLSSDISGSLDRGASVAALGELGDDDYNGGWVQSSGRGVAWSEPGECNLVGGDMMVCEPSTDHVYLSYLMEDGSYWGMSSVTVGGQDPAVTWTDGSGDVVDAPRFRDS